MTSVFVFVFVSVSVFVFVFVKVVFAALEDGISSKDYASPPQGSNGLMSSPERKLMRKGVMTSAGSCST